MPLLWQCCHTNTARQQGKHWIINGGLTLHLMDWHMPFLWQCHHANTNECNRCKNGSMYQGVVKVYKNALPFWSYSSLNVYGTFFCCSVHASVLRFSSWQISWRQLVRHTHKSKHQPALKNGCGHISPQDITEVGNSSAGGASDWKARCNADMGSSTWCVKGFFSHSQLSVTTLWQCPYSPRVHQHLCAC